MSQSKRSNPRFYIATPIALVILVLLWLRGQDQVILGASDALPSPTAEAYITQDVSPSALSKNKTECIDPYEVTNEQYAAFLNSFVQDYGPLTSDELNEWIVMDDNSPFEQTVNGAYNVSDRSDQAKPVVNVTWIGALAYCSYYGQDIPTPEQWRLAAGGTTSLYPWGDETPDSTRANYRETGYNALVATGSFSDGKSQCGAYDMAGNAAEWTGTEVEAYVLGGSFMSDPVDLQIASGYRVPSHTVSDNVGFRCINPPEAPLK